MPLYNIISCSGWEGGAGWVGASGCIMSRIGLVILFFLIAIIRRWGGEEVGLDFNFILSLIIGLGLYLVIVTIFGSFKMAFLLGLIGALAGGYLGGMFFGGEE